jgi:predicted transposase YbfD/YdcC
MEGFSVYRCGTQEDLRQARKHGRVAVLHIQQGTAGTGPLLWRARLEWSVETMHWLLDVHFREDFCRVEDKNVQENMNMVRKIALNSIKHYKGKTHSKSPIARTMLECLLDTSKISALLMNIQN